MQAPDLPLLSVLSRPTIHPDGGRAVVSVVRADFEADDYRGQLWSVALTGVAKPRRVTRGHRDTAPRFSPDGRLLAFLRSTPGGPAQLHVVDAAGGEPVTVTAAPLGVSEWRWRPDSTGFAFLARVPEHGRYGTVPGLESGAEPARRFTTLRYRSNGLGYTTDRRSHIFLVAVPDVWGEPSAAAAPSAPDPDVDGLDLGALAVNRKVSSGLPLVRQLSSGDFDHSCLQFSPDGTRLLTVSARHGGRDRDLCSELVEFNLVEPAAGARPTERIRLAASARLSVTQILWAADSTIYLLAQDVGASGRDFVGRNSALYSLESGGPVRLSDPETVDLDGSGGFSVDPAGAVVVQNNTRGVVQLVRITPEGTLTVLSAVDTVVTGHDLVGERIVAAVTDAATAGDLELVAEPPRRLSDFSAPLRATGIVVPHELTVTGRDGYPVHGWVLTPGGPGPHPVLLTIHGGPFSQYTVALFDEAQVYVDAGYAVVLCNPRGSAGYGQAHGRSIRQKLGTIDAADVLDFLDGALADDSALDGDRLGIQGGSYGGYLTAWTIANDHRFVASIVERGFLDPEGFVGTSDIGDFFGDEYTGTDPELMRSQSPQFFADRVRTPTLVMHSERDLRCPLAQGERFYSALKRGGVATELVVFPGENHELSRGGSPRHRLQRFEVILDWWARFLPTTRNPR